MLQPSRTKFRKAHKGRIKGKATRGAALNFGSHGLQAVEPERITSRQIEAARVALTRHMQRKGRVWLRISPEFWVCRVKPGRIIFEIDGVSDIVAKESFDRAASKLPIKTKVIKRNLNL